MIQIFTNNLMTGEEHRQKALERINIWLEQRFDFGFSELVVICVVMLIGGGPERLP